MQHQVNQRLQARAAAVQCQTRAQPARRAWVQPTVRQARQLKRKNLVALAEGELCRKPVPTRTLLAICPWQALTYGSFVPRVIFFLCVKGALPNGRAADEQATAGCTVGASGVTEAAAPDAAATTTTTTTEPAPAAAVAVPEPTPTTGQTAAAPASDPAKSGAPHSPVAS